MRATAGIKRGKWINGKIRITKSGKIEAMVPRSAVKNPASTNLGDSAWEAGRRWKSGGSDSSGVANSRVVRYGFLKWYNNQRPEDLKGTITVGGTKRWTKTYLEKLFRQGYKSAR